MSAIPGPASMRAEAPAAAGQPGVESGEASISAAKGGALLLVAAVISLAANYLFLLGAGRLLGSADFGTVAALAGLLTVVLLPTGAVQMAVSREVSRREALGEHVEAAAFVRRLVVLGAKATVPLLLVALALLVPLRELLQIDATAPVALALTALVGVFLYPISLGALQGQQRFRALAFNSAAPMVVRILVFVALVVVGVRLYGALAAVAISAVAGTAIVLLAIRRQLSASRGLAAPELRPFLRYLVPVAVGLFGIAVLTNVDLLVVKARFPADDAGVYAAASAFARVAFFLPATILAVLFPRTAARQARGEQSADILGRSLIVTAAFCAGLTVTYAIVGGPVIDLTFGDEFSAAAGLLAPFCVAMTCFSLANVVLGYHLSRGESRYAWVVASSIVVQIAVLATIPDTLRGVLWTDAAVGVGLLVAHELTVGSSASALAAGYRHLGVGTAVSRVAGRLLAAWRLLAEIAVVFIGYTLLAVAVTWPLARHMGDRMLGPFPNDGSGGAWWFWQLHQEQGYRLLGPTHHTLTGAPLGWEQGSALNYQWLMPNYPGYVLSGVLNEVATFNVLVLGGLVLSAAAMYLLVRWLGCGRLVSAWAGLVYLVFPWHLERAMAGHPSLAHLEIFPLLLLAGIAWVRRPTNGRAGFVALAVLGAWFISGYFGAMTIVALIGITGAGVIINRSELGWLTAIGRAVKVWAMAIIAVAAFGLTAVMVGGTTASGVGRNAAELEFYGAHLHDYLPDPANPLVGWVATNVGSATIGYYPGVENVLYPGLLTVALALTWLVVVVRRWSSVALSTRVATLVLAAVGVVMILFATPNPVHIAGVAIQPMPSFLMIKVLPSFRVPSRLIVVTMVALIAIAALGLAYLIAAARRRYEPGRTGSIVATALCAAACVISVAELAPIPIEMSRVGDTPAAYAAVAQTPEGVLAEYPLTVGWESPTLGYMYWQRVHGRPLLNGAAENTDADSVRRMLIDPTAPGTAGSLALLGVTAIVTRPDTFEWPNGWAPGDPVVYGPGYELVDRETSGVRVWKVVAAPAPAVAAWRTVDVSEPKFRAPDGHIGYPLTGSVVHVDLYAKQSGLWRLNFDSRLRRARARLVVAGHSRSRSIELGPQQRISLPILVPRGHSTISLNIVREENTRGKPADVSFSSTWFTKAEPGERASAVVPLVISSEPGF